MVKKLFAVIAGLTVGVSVLSATAGASSGTETFRFIFTGDPTPAP